jgi:Domain of unknown function (DUF4845)
MRLTSKFKQRGVSLLGVIFVGGVLVCAGVVLVQVAPTYLEYQKISAAVNKAKSAGSPAEARSTFDKAAVIDDIKAIRGKDLEITTTDGKAVIKFAYNKEIHLVGPAFLLLKYSGSSI